MARTVSDPKRSQEAQTLEAYIKAGKAAVGSHIFHLGETLKKIRDNQYYLELGYQTISEWLNSPEIDIAERTAYMFIDLFETLIVNQKISIDKLAGVDYSKLHRILPIIKQHPEKTEEWVDKAISLRRIDLQREIREFHLAQLPPISPTTNVHPQMLTGYADEEMARLAPGFADAIITVPPSSATSQQHTDWLDQAQRVLKDTGNLVMICSAESFIELGVLAVKSGFTPLHGIVWAHSAFSAVSVSKLKHEHDMILWFHKGANYVNMQADIKSDVWNLDFEPEYDYPRDVPIQVVTEILELTTQLGAIIVDPFAHVGSVCVAAKILGRNFIGIESNQQSQDIANKRLAKV